MDNVCSFLFWVTSQVLRDLESLKTHLGLSESYLKGVQNRIENALSIKENVCLCSSCDR